MLKLFFLLLFFMQVAHASELEEATGGKLTESRQFFLIKTGDESFVSVVMGTYSDEETVVLLGIRVFTDFSKEGMDAQLQAAYKLDTSVAIGSDEKLRGLREFFHKAGAPEEKIKRIVLEAQCKVKLGVCFLASSELLETSLEHFI